MIDSPSFTDSLPPGCHTPNRGWPWRDHGNSLHFAALRFDVPALARASVWQVELPEGLATAAEKRRAEYVAGRLCARQALADLNGTAYTPGRTPAALPAWPEGSLGSITHSRGLAASVVASTRRYAALGIDAEARMPAERARRLAPQILVETERDWLATLDDTLAGEFVTTAFSLKESLYKALYPLVQRCFYFHDARLIDWNPSGGTATLELLTTLSPSWPAGAQLEGHIAEIDDYLLTLIAIPRQL